VQRTLIIGALALVAGCGSGGGGDTNDGGIPPGSGALAWKDGATSYSALGPAAARVVSASLDMLQITGGVAGGAAAIAFSVATAPPLLPGSYACSDSGTGGRIVSISYVEGTAMSSGVPTCAIDVASIGDVTGARVTGTFSATLNVGGTTTTLSDGAFDLGLTVSSL
jgi:hypothetical protein